MFNSSDKYKLKTYQVRDHLGLDGLDGNKIGDYSWRRWNSEHYSTCRCSKGMVCVKIVKSMSILGKRADLHRSNGSRSRGGTTWPSEQISSPE